jgi:predicted phosphate transport protein (TIGR00153 family)
MPFSLVPKERQFFVLFRDNAATLMESIRTLDALLNNRTGDFGEEARKLNDLEHKGDEITHRMNRELNQTFLTPFDREDIYALAGAVDDVIDLVEETADTIILDGITEITDEARQMGDILVKIGEQLVQAFDKLESGKDMAEHWVTINDLENQADRVTRSAIGALFRNGGEPLYVIKWKDVYALLEKTVDRTEDIANILETVSIKNA